MPKKADHKHQYTLYYERRDDRWYRLIKVCNICGYRKEPEFKMNLVHLPDGTRKWLCRKEDIQKQYPGIQELPGS